MKSPQRILPIIVISQFCCTSLWFAGNGVMPDLVRSFALSEGATGHLTSAVQFGFIAGTLTFALLSIADRFSPSKVFFVCAILGATFNLAIIWKGNGFSTIMLSRFLTGYFLAGIYPVGMKIAADHFEKGLGKSLGFLVGALVLGTAFPHLLREVTASFPWKYVALLTSMLAVGGGVLMVLLVPDGPFRKASQSVDLSAFFNVFRNKELRSASFGYFGHMWELYAFWAFVPLMLQTYNETHSASLNIPLWSFLIIGLGGPACVLGGYLAQSFGTKKVATLSLLLSGICCIIFPVMFMVDLKWLFVSFLIFWGWVVIADSPLFSTLVAQNATSELKGTALTIVNCIGFAITILSIQAINLLQVQNTSTMTYLMLGLGPLLGLIGLFAQKKR